MKKYVIVLIACLVISSCKVKIVTVQAVNDPSDVEYGVGCPPEYQVGDTGYLNNASEKSYVPVFGKDSLGRGVSPKVVIINE